MLRAYKAANKAEVKGNGLQLPPHLLAFLF
jgi:hypothetical protein